MYKIIDTKTNKVFYADEIGYSQGFLHIGNHKIPEDDAKILWSTNTRDSKGNLIYEDDIIFFYSIEKEEGCWGDTPYGWQVITTPNENVGIIKKDKNGFYIEPMLKDYLFTFDYKLELFDFEEDKEITDEEIEEILNKYKLYLYELKEWKKYIIDELSEWKNYDEFKEEYLKYDNIDIDEILIIGNINLPFEFPEKLFEKMYSTARNIIVQNIDRFINEQKKQIKTLKISKL